MLQDRGGQRVQSPGDGVGDAGSIDSSDENTAQNSSPEEE